MNDISPEIQKLWNEYKGDTKQLLKEHAELEYLYALSDIRENILEWYDFSPEATLLQVGSDYGALTGLFGRKVKQVTVLDPSEDNLKVNALRQEKLNNIRYVTGGISSPQVTDEEICGDNTGFDYVVMVGSLEPPCKPQIARAKSLLKPGGRLILGVCNKFGLKYLAGAEPDACSFSKQEITDLLTAGRNNEKERLDFYYPMPDYKLPVTIYSDGYLPGKGDLTDTVIAYDYPRYLRLEVGELYDAVCEDRRFAEFANSFLIIWSSHEEN